MLKTTGTIVALSILIALITSGCRYSAPVAESTRLPIDRSLLGVWGIGQNGTRSEALESLVRIREHNPTTYAIELKNMDEPLMGTFVFRGYLLPTEWPVQLQLRFISYLPSKDESGMDSLPSSPTPFDALSYRVDGDSISVRFLNEKVISPELDTSTAIQAVLRARGAAPNLYDEPFELRRTREELFDLPTRAEQRLQKQRERSQERATHVDQISAIFGYPQFFLIVNRYITFQNRRGKLWERSWSVAETWELLRQELETFDEQMRFSAVVKYRGSIETCTKVSMLVQLLEYHRGKDTRIYISMPEDDPYSCHSYMKVESFSARSPDCNLMLDRDLVRLEKWEKVSAPPFELTESEKSAMLRVTVDDHGEHREVLVGEPGELCH